MALLHPNNETAVANEALDHLGKEPIDDIETSQSDAAKTMRRHFASVRDALQRRYPWNYCTGPALLQKSPTAPVAGFKSAYVFSNEPYCLAVRELFDCRRERWKVSGRRVLCDLTSGTARARITWRETTVALWDVQFRNGFALALAAAGCIKLTEDNTLKGSLSEEAERGFEEAFGVDASEGTSDAPETPDVILARF